MIDSGQSERAPPRVVLGALLVVIVLVYLAQISVVFVVLFLALLAAASAHAKMGEWTWP